ncbi:MAG: DNA cytosine methyltransferase [Alphaproteobacteria bacterium]|nr:DNA cytosine methyltransferase [Alphaproteobacteria bacterium]
MRTIKYFHGFSSAALVTEFAKPLGFECTLLNELDPMRLLWAKESYNKKGEYPDCCRGDFTDPKIFDELVRKFNEKNLELALFSPCCQPFSKAGGQHLDSPEAFLFLHIIDFIKYTLPKWIWIENAEEFPTSVLTDDPRTIEQRIRDALEPLGYVVKVKIQDAADFGVPQHRRRSIFLISRKDVCTWEFPEPFLNQITVRQAIGQLPTLKAGERSYIPFHNAPWLPKCQADCFINVPDGGTAPNPVNVDGSQPKKQKPKYAFRRIYWDKPCNTIVQKSASVSGYQTVHPRDNRTLTVFEIILLTGLDQNWYIPIWARCKEQIIRDVLGECFAPKHATEILKMLRQAIDKSEL